MSNFSDVVKQTVENVLKSLQDNKGFMMVKPIVNFAKPHLYEQLEKDPAEVYAWLKKAREEINKAMKVYEDEHKA